VPSTSEVTTVWRCRNSINST